MIIYAMEQYNQLTETIIGCGIRVHKVLGPGMLESAYRQCLAYELHKKGLIIEEEKPMPVIYDEIRLNQGYRLDLLVENTVVIELKTVEAFSEVHQAQILTYMRLGAFPIGLLMNFNVTALKNGIKRYVLG